MVNLEQDETKKNFYRKKYNILIQKKLLEFKQINIHQPYQFNDKYLFGG